ncbi:bifunctional riboflavin kinase/FAD synthetase [Spongiactinospora sp. TRM90649]|uniref:bifunctional riboflavin kinase/FAD synthetase n=1 Tax=Spongiactinospora sp. TRM90649 TaxID=3031114 RepID=UPI0023F796E0|nr:bifunctional riboflavin kinase/FAD synthetase [Spongiactinospora sp. TRM90649]MDF5753995.1 bifunctional riboflavin kinase/FAD synthetase [Spongiactinospora sp. TRM90649]
MRSWHGLDDVPDDLGRSVVTIGVFDGIHRGHQRVLGRVAEVAGERGIPSVAVTFDVHPEEILLPGTHPPRLTTQRHRMEIFEDLGLDEVCVVPFTVEFSALTPEKFAQVVLADGLRAAVVVVGVDFRFGHRAAGDVEALRALGEKYDFTVETVPLVNAPGEGAEPASSSLVRRSLDAGEVEAASEVLGRPHRVEGVVVRGHQRGRKLGVPTANVESPPHTAIPADGVYAGWLRCVPRDDVPAAYGGERWSSAISIGTNPTFDGAVRTVEAHVVGRDDLDLYGTHVAVEFGHRLRDHTKFESIDALIDQMRADIAETLRLTG